MRTKEDIKCDFLVADYAITKYQLKPILEVLLDIRELLLKETK